ncbi:MAG: DNA methyltransferase [Rhodobacteraceae bacterium]|nr:DNA methyltransferase [Paracoccaceae bacterium]
MAGGGRGMKYNLIYADPPWQYRDKAQAGKRGAESKYKVMSIDNICDLGMGQIAADHAVLAMWVTYPFLTVFDRVVRAWGFTYKTVAFTWVKRNKVADSWFFGMGNWTRSNAEICILATRGKPKRASASVPQILDDRIMRHSQKPDTARSRLVELCGDVPRIELFCRQPAPGWDSWGNEIGGLVKGGAWWR